MMLSTVLYSYSSSSASCVGGCWSILFISYVNDQTWSIYATRNELTDFLSVFVIAYLSLFAVYTTNEYKWECLFLLLNHFRHRSYFFFHDEFIFFFFLSFFFFFFSLFHLNENGCSNVIMVTENEQKKEELNYNMQFFFSFNLTSIYIDKKYLYFT